LGYNDKFRLNYDKIRRTLTKFFALNPFGHCGTMETEVKLRKRNKERILQLKHLKAILLTLGLFLAAMLPVSAVSVDLDGQLFEDCLLVEDTTYVALRSFGELAAGTTATWDAASKSAFLSGNSLSLTAVEGGSYMIANGRYLYSERTPLISDGKLYVPLRPLAKALGGEVSWNGDTEQAVYRSTGSIIEPGSSYYDADELYWLSRIISAESRGEPLIGQIAVGNVVLNRVRSEEFPNTIYSVIFDRKYGVQFTPVANQSIYMEPTESSMIAAKIVLDGYSISEDILYFLDKSLATSFWIVENRTHAFKIGCHDFYT